MADVNFFEDFERVWGSTGDVEAIDQNQYDQGWAFIGATPPSVEQFNKVQQVSDQKAAWLFAQIKELAEQRGYGLTAGMVDALARGIASSMQVGAGVVGVDTGAANTYVVNYSPAIAALSDGMVLWFKVKTANTGASTLNINGLGARPILGMGNTELQGGEFAANGKALVVWKADANSWVLVASTGGAAQVAPATAGGHAMRLDQAVGRLIGVQVFTASGTYTPTPGTKSVVVEVQGGGGAGGGTVVTGASQCAVGGGGGAGAYGKGRFTSGFSGVTVTVGAGGVGVSGGAGGPGGTSSFGALLSAPGGANGPSGLASNAPGITGGNNSLPATGGNIVNASGGNGSPSFALTTGGAIQGGAGGASQFGGGAPTSAGSVNGNNATSKGAGGSGTAAGQSWGSLRGGDGAPGIVIVWEYA